MFWSSVWKKKTFCDVTLASTDSDNFEAVILSEHSYILNIMMVFVGGIKDKVLKAMSNELFYATEYKYQGGNDYFGYADSSTDAKVTHT